MSPSIFIQISWAEEDSFWSKTIPVQFWIHFPIWISGRAPPSAPYISLRMGQCVSLHSPLPAGSRVPPDPMRQPHQHCSGLPVSPGIKTLARATQRRPVAACARPSTAAFEPTVAPRLQDIVTPSLHGSGHFFFVSSRAKLPLRHWSERLAARPCRCCALRCSWSLSSNSANHIYSPLTYMQEYVVYCTYSLQNHIYSVMRIYA
jgi:hypothetical protein